MVALGCASNSTKLKLMHNYSFTHISIFRSILNFKVGLYTYHDYSTENCMLTVGKIGVACYFWMALYIIYGVIKAIKKLES